MMFSSVSSFVVLALTAASALASPTLNARATGYKVLSDGTKGTVSGPTADFGATFHASAFLSQRGCSSTALITDCYTAKLSPSGQLETADAPPYVKGGVGSKQRSVLIMPPVTVTGETVTHRFKVHLSTEFNAIPEGETVTITAFHNEFQGVGGFNTFALEAKTFTGEETSGTYIYLNADGQSTTQYAGFADGKTVEFTFQFNIVNGTTVSSRIVETGEEDSGEFFARTDIVQGTQHAITLGPARNPVEGSQNLKMWFGDYSVTQS